MEQNEKITLQNPKQTEEKIILFNNKVLFFNIILVLIIIIIGMPLIIKEKIKEREQKVIVVTEIKKDI